MASSISGVGEGGPVRTITALLESNSSGVASVTLDLSTPANQAVFGKAFSWSWVPFTDSYQPSNNASATIVDAYGRSIIRSPSSASAALSNSTPFEEPVLYSGQVCPFVITNGVLTFGATGMGNGKKAYLILNILR